MKVLSLKYPIEQIPFQEKIVLVLGFFDGVHLGHQALISDAKKIANKKKLPLVVMTFDRHPQEVYQSNVNFVYLDTIKEKEHKMKKLEVNTFIIAHFDQNFSKIQPQTFVDDIIVKLKTDTLVVGFDYTYGPKEIANVDNLPKFAKNRFEIIVESEKKFSNLKIGSTGIRNAILNGDISLANQLLGRAYTISGTIVHGFRRGHQIGFPTVNLKSNDSKVIPKIGVYATMTLIRGKWYKSMTNVGYNETFNNTQKTIESHLFDFDEETYGEPITIKWLEFIRGDKKFNNIEDLTTQLKEDEDKVLRVLSR